MGHKIAFILLLLPALLLCNSLSVSAYTPRLDSLLQVLDETIEQNRQYSDRREAQIGVVRKQLDAPDLSDLDKYRLTRQLARLYNPYICDSAISCLNRGILLADRLQNPRLQAESRIGLAYLLGSSGMYMEALDVLREVDRTAVDTTLLLRYYATYDHIYGESGYYTQDKRLGQRYWNLSVAYKDSISRVANHASDFYLQVVETRLRDENRLEEALQLNKQRATRIPKNTREYATLLYYRALIYREMNASEPYRSSLALSAITDIRSAVKDHASLWMLAQALLDDGDVERAYRYMDFSWSASSFYNARLRAWQSVEYLSVIDSTYQLLLHKRNAVLQRYILFVSVLTVLLILALICIWRQMKRLARARRELLAVNGQLHDLNADLQRINAELQQANANLREANTIKENYLGRFIKLCSTYVDRLEAFRRMAGKMLSTGKSAELLKISRSSSVLDEALNELYSNFDTVFLRIFPDFVARFNALLRDDEQILPKAEGQLNTELRIFALIRLGITDSSQIAEFLHYSVNTIYNYRAKVKNKARNREDFEENVAHIQ